MKFTVQSELGATELDTNELPPELPELYSKFENKNFDLPGYLILAEAYSSKEQLGNSIILLNKGTDIASDFDIDSIPQDSLTLLVSIITAYCFFLVNLCSSPKLYRSHFDGIQDTLARTVALLKQLAPLNADLPVIKGFWQLHYQDYNRAAIYFTKALSRDPIKPLATLGLAISSYYRGNYDLALTKFLRFATMARNEDSIKALTEIMDFRIGIALCQIELGREDAAIKVLQGTLKQSPEKVEPYALMAFIRLKQFKYGINRTTEFQQAVYKDAMRICTNTLETHPKHPSLSLILSELHFFARKYEEAYTYAMVAYQEADPEAKTLRGEACYNAAKVKYLVGDDALANQLLEQALENSPNHEPSLVLQGLLLFKEGDTERALKKLESIVAQGQLTIHPQLFSNDIHLNLLYIILYSRLNKPNNSKDYLLSGSEFGKHLAFVKNKLEGSDSLTPATRYDIFTTLVEVAKAYEKRQGWIGAENSYNDSLAAYSHITPPKDLRCALAKCANNAGTARFAYDTKFSKTNDYFQTALQHAELADSSEGNMLSITINYNIALNYEKAGKIQEAKEKLEFLRGKYPTYFNATLKLGLLVQKEGDFNRAVRLYKEVIDITGESNVPQIRQFAIDGYILLGTLQQEQRDYKAARNSFKTVLAKYDGDDFYALCAVGHNYFLVGRHEEDPKRRAEHFKQSTHYFRKAHLAHANNPFPVAGIGCLLAATGQYEIARKVFLEIERTVDSSVFLTNYAHCCYRLKKFELAADLYDKALKNCSNGTRFAILQCHARALYALGIQTKNRKHIERSINQLKEAKALNSREMTLLFDEGLALQKFCQLVCDLDPEVCGTYRVERSLRFLDDAKKNFEYLKTLPVKAQCGFNNHTLDLRIGFCKTIRSTLMQRLEATEAIERARPVKVIETYGMDCSASFERYGILESLPIRVEKAPVSTAQTLHEPTSPYDQHKPLVRKSPILSSDEGEEYDPSEVPVRSPKKFRKS